MPAGALNSFRSALEAWLAAGSNAGSQQISGNLQSRVHSQRSATEFWLRWTHGLSPCEGGTKKAGRRHQRRAQFSISHFANYRGGDSSARINLAARATAVGFSGMAQ
jgi:hypothetical protein